MFQSNKFSGKFHEVKSLATLSAKNETKKSTQKVLIELFPIILSEIVDGQASAYRILVEQRKPQRRFSWV